MKLEKYLADYIMQEIENSAEFSDYIKRRIFDFEEIIKQGLDAFESTEDCGIKIVPLDPDIPAFYWSKQ